MKYKNYLIFCEVNEVNEVLGSTKTTEKSKCENVFCNQWKLVGYLDGIHHWK